MVCHHHQTLKSPYRELYHHPTTYNTYPDILWHIVTLGIADNTSQQFLLAILFQAVYLT